MDKFLLFQFWVKPTGLFASKRYANVFYDINGNITVEDVDGKPSINLPSITDYKSTNFPYGEGNDVTGFCNTDTFTYYNIKASLVNPWAYTTATIDAPQCGYMTPLPTPAVPPNPFGTANYGLFAFLEYCTIDGVPKTVNIYKRNYSGAATEIEEGGKSPIKYRVTADLENKFEKVRPKECEFSFIATQNFQLRTLYTSDEREYRLEVINEVTGIKDFLGFIVPDSSSEAFSAPPYPVTVRATDGLGALKTITYPLPVGSAIDVRQSFLFMLAYALAKTNLNLNIRTMVNIYAIGMANGLGDDPMAQASASPLRMVSDGAKVYSCFQALEALCAQFGASIFQEDGEWRFARVTEFAKGTGRYRLYDYTARFINAGTDVTLREMGSTDKPVVIEKGATVSILPPYKLVRVKLDYGKSPDIVFNGDFEQWDGFNFNYWTRYGGINISRVQKTVTASNGVQVPIEDWACRFNERANSGKWLQASNIWVNREQSIKLSMNIGKTSGYYLLKTRIKVGQYYLTNANGSFQWITQLATVSTAVNNTVGSIQSFQISIEIPPVPISDVMVMQIYGFTRVNPVYGGVVFENGQLISDETNVIKFYQDIDEYTAIDIDNVAVSSNVPDSQIVKGALNVSSQNGFYTNKPDEITIIWGELGEGSLDPFVVTGSLQPATPNGLNNNNVQLQTIYLPDGSTAKGWYEFGESNSPIPIGLALARAILKAYQLPYESISCKAKGQNLKYYDTFNIIVPNENTFSQKIFMWQEAVFDDKYNEVDGDLVEIFTKNIVSNDYTAPETSNVTEDDLLPPIIQNPNPPLQINGIFTEQFTPEYS